MRSLRIMCISAPVIAASWPHTERDLRQLHVRSRQLVSSQTGGVEYSSWDRRYGDGKDWRAEDPCDTSWFGKEQ